MNRVNEQIVRMGDSPCTDLMQKSEAGACMNEPCFFKAPTQTGRSMVEMLGVLAIVGVLSIAGLMGYRYAMNKHKANLILNDVSLAWADIYTEQERSPEESRISFLATSPFEITVQRLEVEETGIGYDFVYVAQVPTDICHMLLNAKNGGLKIYKKDDLSQELTSCNTTSDLAFTFDVPTSSIKPHPQPEPSDPCDDISCLNGGECFNGFCDCPNDYTGDFCEEHVKACQDTSTFWNCPLDYSCGATEECCSDGHCCPADNPQYTKAKNRSEEYCCQVGQTAAYNDSQYQKAGCCTEGRVSVAVSDFGSSWDNTFCCNPGEKVFNAAGVISYNGLPQGCCPADMNVIVQSGGASKCCTEGSTFSKCCQPDAPQYTKAKNRSEEYCCQVGQTAAYNDSQYQKAGCCTEGRVSVAVSDFGSSWDNTFCCNPGEKVFNAAGVISYNGLPQGCCPADMNVIVQSGGASKCCTEGSTFSKCCQPDAPQYTKAKNRSEEYCCQVGQTAAYNDSQYQKAGCCTEGRVSVAVSDFGSSWDNTFCCNPGEKVFNAAGVISYNGLSQGCCPADMIVVVNSQGASKCCAAGSTFDNCVQN